MARRPSSGSDRRGCTRGWLVAALVVGPGMLALPARAHIELLSPPARYPPGMQKDEPCGHPLDPPGEEPPTVYQAGETITVRFNEFVSHPGHFRVALDPTGTDSFTSPADFDDFYNSPEVVLDDIPHDRDGGLHEVELTLPDLPCDPCTLQLIQVMTEDGAFGPGDDDLYFQCADIVLEPASTTDEPTTGSTGSGMPGDGGASDDAAFETGDLDSGSGGSTDADADADEGDGCSCRGDPRRSDPRRRGPRRGGPGPGGAALWLLAVLVAGRRRRG